MAVLRSKKEKATGISRAELPNPARVAPAAARNEAIKKMEYSHICFFLSYSKSYRSSKGTLLALERHSKG